MTLLTLALVLTPITFATAALITAAGRAAHRRAATAAEEQPQ